MIKKKLLLNSLLYLLLFLFSKAALGQKNDSILIKKVIHHPVVDGKHLMDYHVHNQLTAGIDGLTIRNLFFNDSTNRLDHYHFYWYRNGSLTRDEKYDNKDNLIELVKYSNTREGKPLIKEIFIHVPDTVEPDSIFSYHYQNNQLVELKISIKNRRKPIVKKYSYTGEGKTENISIKGKGSGKTFPREINYSYKKDDQDRMVLKEKTEIWKKKEVREKWEYQYKDNRIEKIKYQLNNEPEWEKEFVYYPDGKKKIVITRDKDGNELSFVRYEYDAKIINLGVNKNYNRKFLKMYSN